MKRSALALLIAVALPATSARAADWTSYGNGPAHDFTAGTTLTPSTVHRLRIAWYFHTGKAVTAEPIVANGVAYFGSWDGQFYALDLATGRRRWSFTLDPQPAVSPQPSDLLPSPTSDGGLVTATAWYDHARGLIVFAGGYTLYALRADTGALVWKRAFAGLPGQPPDPAGDETRIFSSPIVSGGLVIFGVSPDGQSDHRGYLQAVRLSDGTPVWRFETDPGPNGTVRNDGCGGIWSSPTLVPGTSLLVAGIADCNFRAGHYLDERVIAVDAPTGRLAWVFTPPRIAQGDPACDFDFGATANAGTGFVGIGGKDGTYYSLDPATGALRWATNVVFGGFAGGFIASTAYDGSRVYGATALGDAGRFEGVGTAGCEFGNRRDLPVQEPSSHALDAATGRVAWQGFLTQSFAPTVVAGGMVFQTTGITRQFLVRDAGTGALVSALPLPAPSDSGVVVSGSILLLGLGSSEQDLPDGVLALRG